MNPEQQQASPDRSPNEAAMGTLSILELSCLLCEGWLLKSWVSKEGLQGSGLWNEMAPEVYKTLCKFRPCVYKKFGTWQFWPLKGSRVAEGCRTDKGECEVLKDIEKVRDKECEDLKAKCEDAMMKFDNNLTVNMLYEKITSLSAVEASLRQDVKDIKRDRAEVVSKLLPYMAIELVYSDVLGMLVGKLASAFVFYGRCAAFEEVAKMKDPFNLSKLMGYRSLYKKEHTKARNDLATANFPFLYEFVVDPFAPGEVLPSKKLQSLQRPAPTKTLAPTHSKVTPATALVS
uniref:Uncharacterized protein n=1 Tax=Tanacetum cinerariifolium TaxID=118510 RepID=A0A6L2KEJ3_TANCI|nr:hypothetical protein [Tanacetum cinerariifolium]